MLQYTEFKREFMKIIDRNTRLVIQTPSNHDIFFMSSLTTPPDIIVLIATITSPVYRMIHNHYITKERNEIAKTRKIKTTEINSMLEEQPSLEAAGSNTYPLPNPIIELRSKGKQPSGHITTLQERERQLSERELTLQRKEKRAPSLQDISFLGRRRANSLPSREKPTNINTQGKQPTAAPSCSSTT